MDMLEKQILNKFIASSWNQQFQKTLLQVLLYMICQATRAKDVFQKYVDSVLAKCAKIRSLISDLAKNYPEDQTAKKSLVLIRCFLGPNDFNVPSLAQLL